MLGVFRSAKGVYSRNSNKKKADVSQRFRVSGELTDVELRIKDEHPAPLLLPHLSTPGLLTDADPDARWEDLPYGYWLRELRTAKLPPGNLKIVISDDSDPYKFGRVLAKIAHCETVNHFGLDGFVPFLPKIILGEDTRIPYFIGGIEGRHEPLNAGYLWALRLLRYKDDLLIVHVLRLFANIALRLQPVGTPYYVSIVGKTNDNTKPIEQLGSGPIKLI
jgi:hypothetical protein